MKLKIFDVSNSAYYISFQELHSLYVGYETNPYDKNIILIYSRR